MHSVSTHDIDMAIQLSDEMIIMTPKTVQDDPVILFRKEVLILYSRMNILSLIVRKGSL
jgi:ABC-type nitrate/sulfonate/bicarbonate transport system ATPase subunit